jgi:hypothetical protein
MKKATYIRLRRLSTQALTLVIVSSVLYVYFNTSLFTIKNYKIIGAPEEYVSDLDKQARLIAENKLFYILPGNRIVSYHNSDIKTLIKETLPNSKTIAVYPSGLHTLTIRLTHHTPLFSVSDTHAISEDGTVYQEIVPLDQFPRLEVASSSSVHPRTLKAVADLVEKVDAVLYPIQTISVDEYNDVRLYDVSRKKSIIISNTANMNIVWSNILSAIDTDPLKSKLSNPSEHLEYIDTRFGNKVFYKFTNGSVPAITPERDTTTATTTLR